MAGVTELFGREPLVEARLGEPSRAFAVRLFAALPQLRPGAQMIVDATGGPCRLYVEAPSPTGDAHRRMGVWVDESDEPGVGFGPTHTHASVWAVEHKRDPADGIIDLAKAILTDRVVLLVEAAGPWRGHAEWIDLGRRDALLTALTDRYASGRAAILSWSGAADRDVSLDDLSF